MSFAYWFPLCWIQWKRIFVNFLYISFPTIFTFFSLRVFHCHVLWMRNPYKKIGFVLKESGKQWQGKCKSVRAFSVMFVTRMLLMDVINDDYCMCVCVCVYLVKKCTLVALSHFLWAIRAISLLSHIFSHTSNAHSLLCITFQVSKVDSLE